MRKLLTLQKAMDLYENNPQFWQQLADQLGTSKADVKRLVAMGAVETSIDGKYKLKD